LANSDLSLKADYVEAIKHKWYSSLITHIIHLDLVKHESQI
jgi:hypothetical protein